jgi:hypothetical protein
MIAFRKGSGFALLAIKSIPAAKGTSCLHVLIRPSRVKRRCASTTYFSFIISQGRENTIPLLLPSSDTFKFQLITGGRVGLGVHFGMASPVSAGFPARTPALHHTCPGRRCRGAQRRCKCRDHTFTRNLCFVGYALVSIRRRTRLLDQRNPFETNCQVASIGINFFIHEVREISCPAWKIFLFPIMSNKKSSNNSCWTFVLVGPAAFSISADHVLPLPGIRHCVH